MRGLWLGSEGLQLREDLALPAPRLGEARIRVTLAGVCNTDLELARGYMGFAGTPGHEFVGVVEACDDPAWRGRRVVGEINCGCGGCAGCRAGDPRHCPDRTVLGILGRDGSFAEHLTLPVANLHEVPASLSDEEAVFAEPLAAACQILDQVAVRPTQRVVVFGDGKLGVLVGQVLARTGCALTVVGKHRSKLAVLAEQGIDTLLLDEHRSRPSPRADLVVEASGTASGLEAAVAAVRPRGTIVLKTTVADAVRLHLAPLVIDEITVVGSRCGPFEPALRALAARTVRVAPLIHARYPLQAGLEAFAHAARPGVVKVLLEVGKATPAAG